MAAWGHLTETMIKSDENWACFKKVTWKEPSELNDAQPSAFFKVKIDFWYHVYVCMHASLVLEWVGEWASDVGTGWT